MFDTGTFLLNLLYRTAITKVRTLPCFFFVSGPKNLSGCKCQSSASKVQFKPVFVLQLQSVSSIRIASEHREVKIWASVRLENIFLEAVKHSLWTEVSCLDLTVRVAEPSPLVLLWRNNPVRTSDECLSAHLFVFDSGGHFVTLWFSFVALTHEALLFCFL